MDTLMLMELMLTELFLLVPALVWTQSPKDLTQLPKELLLTMERGLLMLSMLDTHTPMLDTHMPMLDIHMDMFHLDHPQELTQSPRVWTQSLKDLSTSGNKRIIINIFNIYLTAALMFSDTRDVKC